MNDTPPTSYDFDPQNLPPEFLKAIGLMAAASAQTEAVMQHLIGSFLQIDLPTTLGLTAHMSAPLKDQAARTLVELSSATQEHIDELDDLLDAVQEAGRKRNIVVHNSLVRHPVTGEVFSYRESARGSLQVSLQPVRVEEIERDAALLYKAGVDIMGFMVKHGLSQPDRVWPIRPAVSRGQKARAERRTGGSAG